jgi:hypothetical protein
MAAFDNSADWLITQLLCPLVAPLLSLTIRKMGGKESVCITKPMAIPFTALSELSDAESSTYDNTRGATIHSSRHSMLTTGGSMSWTRTCKGASNRRPSSWTTPPRKAYQLIRSTRIPRFRSQVTLIKKYKKWDGGAAPHSKNTSGRSWQVSPKACQPA